MNSPTELNSNSNDNLSPLYSAIQSAVSSPSYANQPILIDQSLLANMLQLLDGYHNELVLSKQSRQNLENTEICGYVPFQEDNDMAKKIRRAIHINGSKCWISGNTEQEYADNLIKALGISNAASSFSLTEKHKFSDYALNWFEVFSRPNVSEATTNAYRSILNKHLIPKLGELFIEDISPAAIQAMFNAADLKHESLKKIRTVLRMILQHALEDDIIQKNPLLSQSIRIKGDSSEETEPYTVTQMQHLVQNLHSIKNDRDRAFLALHATHTMRLEEVLGLQWRDVDLTTNTLHIRRVVTHPDRNRPIIKEPKTEKSKRTLALVPQIMKYLTPGEPTDFVVGGTSPLSYTQVRRMCERIAKDTSFGEKLLPRRLRTTVLTDLYDTTKDIKQTQQAAGHTTSAMTLKHYVKGRGEQADTANAIANVYGVH